MHIDRHKINRNSLLSSSVNSLSIDIDNLTVEVVPTLEKIMAYGINVLQYKYLNDPKIKGKSLFLNFLRNVHNQYTSFPFALRNDT